jgi:hypothetical protein
MAFRVLNFILASIIAVSLLVVPIRVDAQGLSAQSRPQESPPMTLIQTKRAFKKCTDVTCECWLLDCLDFCGLACTRPSACKKKFEAMVAQCQKDCKRCGGFM